GGYANRINDQMALLSEHFDIRLFYLFRKKDESLEIPFKSYQLPSEAGERKNSSEVSENPFSLLRPSLILNSVRAVLQGCPLYYAPYFSPKAASVLQRKMEEENIDLVWANGIIGAMLTKNLKARFKVLDV